MSSTSVLAARHIRQILEWDERSSSNPHRVYQFSGRQQDVALATGFCSIQSIQNEHLVVAAGWEGKVSFLHVGVCVQ